MKKEETLLLKDLSARLPYGVKCAYLNTKNELKVGELLTVWCKEKRVFIDKISIDYDGCDCIGVIPYLFPLSSMTEEQKEEYTFIVDYISSDDSETLAEGEFIYVDLITELMHFYNKYHLDYRGLIPKGLALDATGLNIY